MDLTTKLRELQHDDAAQRKRWLEERRQGVGASEAAGVLNVSPWASPLSVYADKTLDRADDGELDDATIERFRWGHILERVILDELTARTGLAFRRAPQHRITRHKAWPEIPMFATPDAYVLEDARRLCQVKTTGSFGAPEWNEAVPLHVNVQVQHEMAVCNREANIVVALIGGQKLVAYEVKRHAGFIDQLEPEIALFWSHVQRRVMPPVDASKAGIAALERLHPDDNGQEVILPPEAAGLDGRIAEVSADIKRLTKEKRELEAEIKAMLGPNTYGRLPGGEGRWSWKTVVRKAYEAKESKYRALRRSK